MLPQHALQAARPATAEDEAALVGEDAEGEASGAGPSSAPREQVGDVGAAAGLPPGDLSALAGALGGNGTRAQREQAAGAASAATLAALAMARLSLQGQLDTVDKHISLLQGSAGGGVPGASLSTSQGGEPSE